MKILRCIVGETLFFIGDMLSKIDYWVCSNFHFTIYPVYNWLLLKSLAIYPEGWSDNNKK